MLFALLLSLLLLMPLPGIRLISILVQPLTCIRILYQVLQCVILPLPRYNSFRQSIMLLVGGSWLIIRVLLLSLLQQAQTMHSSLSITSGSGRAATRQVWQGYVLLSIHHPCSSITCQIEEH